MHRDMSSLRMRQSVWAPASGPLDHQASHGLGTTGGVGAAVQVTQAVLASTAARTLALGDRLNSFWQKDTVISMVTVTEKPANHSGDVALERIALAKVTAVKPSTSSATRAVAVVASARHVIELTNGANHSSRIVLLHRLPSRGHQHLD